MTIDGVDVLDQPQITETPAQLQTPNKSKHAVQQSLMSSVSKNPRKVRGEVHLSQNLLQIERNERTPLNKRAKAQLVEDSQAKAKQDTINWVNDEDNVLMLSPNPSVHHGKGQKDQDLKNLIQTIENEDNQVQNSNSQLILPQKIHQTNPQERQNDDYSEYSSQILKQKLQSQNLKNQKLLQQKQMKVSPFRVEKQDTTGKKVQKHRIVILGSENVGKTCLFLRYMYFDKSKSIQIQQTPNKDGHIFTKTIVGKQFVHEYEIWDFMSQDELEEKQGKSTEPYDIYEQNQDYISWADVILLVFDVQDLGSFKYCQEIGEKLKRSKKVIYVANKCDNTDIEASQKLQDAQLCNRHMMMTISSKNTFGLKNLFTEVDGEFASDFVEVSPESHSLNKQKFDSILVLKSDQQETISLQLAYLSFRVDMRFHEDIVKKQIIVRSIKGEKPLSKIKNIYQLQEIRDKAIQMNNNISGYLLLAVNEELTNTIEFEYASLKQAQLTQIEKQIGKQLNGFNFKSIFLNALFILFAIVAFSQAIKYYSIEKPKPETLKWQQSMIKAEKDIFEYQQEQINEAIKQVKAYTDLLENYENNVSKNLKTLKLYQKVSVEKMDKQVYLLDRMVKNKLALTQSSLFDADLQNKHLQDVKLIEQNIKALGMDNELLNFVQLSKAKIEYDSQINELRVQGVMLKDATQMIYKSYDNYINIFKKQKDPSADQWFAKQHEQFNFKLQEVLRRFSQDASEAESLKQAISALNDPFDKSLIALQKASQNKVSLPLPDKKLLERCQIACGIVKTQACSNIDMPVQKLSNIENQALPRQLTSSDSIFLQASASPTPQSRLETLSQLDTDTGNLVEKSSSRELNLRNLDLQNIATGKMGTKETDLFSAYTTAACSSLLPEEQYSDAYKQGVADYNKQQSEALTTLCRTLILTTFLFFLACCLTRSKKQKFLEKETGADDTDITAEQNGSQRPAAFRDQHS